jgi:PAS domain S-box-containing protein
MSIARRAHRLFLVVATLLAGVVAAGEAAAPAAAAALTVVIDDNYPPYVFRAADGTLTGYLVDTWKLWEKKTGVRVDLLGSDWATAQQRMTDGRAGVLDTAFRTAEREHTLDFSSPYEAIPVSIYTHKDIGGIVDLETLRGFLVGVKAGDACVEKLAGAGISTVLPFASYQALVSGAVEGKVRVFCLDEPPANYLLYLNNADSLFNKAFTLYTGQFHRAVQKGDAATLALLQRGFAGISAEEERHLRHRWMGTPLVLSPMARYLGYALLVGSLIGALLLLWVMTLRRVVRQRTAQLEATLKAIPDPMFEVGLDGRYHDCHSPRTDLLATPPDRLIGRLVTDVLPPEAAATCLSALREAHETGHSLGHQFELLLAGGSLWFQLSVARKPTRSGEAPRFIALSRDITERKRAEARLRMATEATQLVFWELDLIKDRILYDATMLQLLGLDHGEDPASSGALMELVHPDHRTALIERFQEAMQPGDPVFSFEHQIINKSGQCIWLQTRGRVAQRDAAGRAVLAVGTAMNISERKQAEAALLRRSEQLEMMSAASQKLNSELDSPVILRQLVAAALQITGATAGAAARVCEQQMVFIEYNQGGRLLPIDYRFPAGLRRSGTGAADASVPYLSNDAVHDPWVVPEIRQAIGFDNLLDMPIINRDGELLGCFEIHNKPGGFRPNRHESCCRASRRVPRWRSKTPPCWPNVGGWSRRCGRARRCRHSVLASAACGIVATDPQGLITVFNPGAEAILGYRAEEVVGKVTPIVWHDADEVRRVAAAQ